MEWGAERATELRHPLPSSDFHSARFAPRLFGHFPHCGAWSEANPTQYSFFSRGLAGVAAGLYNGNHRYWFHIFLKKVIFFQRLIKMNMPLNEDNTVSFSTTLFALIRTSLNIKLRGNMNANDTELRKMIKNIWPKTSEKVLNKLIPKQSGQWRLHGQGILLHFF